MVRSSNRKKTMFYVFLMPMALSLWLFGRLDGLGWDLLERLPIFPKSQVDESRKLVLLPEAESGWLSSEGLQKAGQGASPELLRLPQIEAPMHCVSFDVPSPKTEDLIKADAGTVIPEVSVKIRPLTKADCRTARPPTAEELTLYHSRMMNLIREIDNFLALHADETIRQAE